MGPNLYAYARPSFETSVRSSVSPTVSIMIYCNATQHIQVSGQNRRPGRCIPHRAHLFTDRMGHFACSMLVRDPKKVKTFRASDIVAGTGVKLEIPTHGFGTIGMVKQMAIF